MTDNNNKGTKRQLWERLIKGGHVLLYLALVGTVAFVYFQAKTTYDTASPQNSYIQCSLGDLKSDKFSLSTLGTSGKYTIHSASLNGNKTGDDLLAIDACNPGFTASNPNAGTCSPITGFCDAPFQAYYGFTTHFVHNDTMNPLEETAIALGVGIVVIEALTSVSKYIVLGKWF